MLSLLTKTRAWAILAGIGLAMLAALKYMSARLGHVKRERDQLEATIEYRDDVAESDAEISNDFSDKRERAKEDVKAGRVPENLRNPNDF